MYRQIHWTLTELAAFESTGRKGKYKSAAHLRPWMTQPPDVRRESLYVIVIADQTALQAPTCIDSIPVAQWQKEPPSPDLMRF
ncbi:MULTISPECIES: hypothetical protein [Streptomyces]|uniref:hypothetical protein n=1 Tax=Streptomyces TaxID=1883 RepID=UPI000FD95994|nr:MULTISPECIES: hypothetical protein [unclassified Streptomyces]MCW1094162.1 hypothetical protein [Streptomyces sp. RS2]